MKINKQIKQGIKPKRGDTKSPESTGRLNIGDINRRNAEEKKEKKSSYITTGIVAGLLIIVMIFFFN